MTSEKWDCKTGSDDILACNPDNRNTLIVRKSCINVKCTSVFKDFRFVTDGSTSKPTVTGWTFVIFLRKQLVLYFTMRTDSNNRASICRVQNLVGPPDCSTFFPCSHPRFCIINISSAINKTY